MPAAAPLSLDEAAAAIGELRAARRRRRVETVDWFEALYRAYLTGIIALLAAFFLSGAVGDSAVSDAGLADVRAHGAAVVGLALALVLAIGLRSGGRGGPLALEAADVRYVLLAPVPRSLALRGPARRQARFAIFSGGLVGVVGGIAAQQRLPGNTIGWMASCGAACAAGALLSTGAAMVVSGRRLPRWMADLLALGVLGWAGADLAAGATTSPTTALGQLALLPVRTRPFAAAGPVVTLVVAGLGLAVVGGCSLEAAERRARLVGQLRFAATLQDVRTVVVLRRQLAQEAPRRRPWIRLGPGKAGSVRGAALRRGAQGILRWPRGRIARLAVFAAAIGLCACGMWRGNTVLIIPGGFALYLAALDAVEPLAQEVDHPDRATAYPLALGALRVPLLAAPAVVIVLVGVLAAIVALVAGGDPALVARVGGTALVPGAVLAAGAASVSVLQEPGGTTGSAAFLPPETLGMVAAGRIGGPPALCMLALLPIVTAHRAVTGTPPGTAQQGAAAGILIVLLVAVPVLGWVRFREDIKGAMSAANPMTAAAAGSGSGGSK